MRDDDSVVKSTRKVPIIFLWPTCGIIVHFPGPFYYLSHPITHGTFMKIWTKDWPFAIHNGKTIWDFSMARSQKGNPVVELSRILVKSCSYHHSFLKGMQVDLKTVRTFGKIWLKWEIWVRFGVTVDISLSTKNSGPICSFGSFLQLWV